MKNAVLFKTHIWNSAISEAYRLCRINAPDSDIFIVFDNTRGAIDIPTDILVSERVFPTSYDQVRALGWEGDDGPNGGFWYNGDYQQNLFCLAHPEYDYICSLEADVGVYNNIDIIFDKMHAQNVDMIYFPIMAPNHPWTWFQGCVGYYDTDRHIHKGLFCISFFSRRACFAIIRRRFEMSVLRRENGWSSWPIGEVVMANEVINHGLHCRKLIDYCDHLEYYDWSPAYLPREFDVNTVGRTFVHSLSNLDHKFFQKNFDMEYRALASEDSVKSGAAAARAHRIDSFAVDCRLLHSVHMQWTPARWQPLLDDALRRLGGEARRIMGGYNRLDSGSLTLNGETAPAAASQVTWPLPSWVAQHALEIGIADELDVVLPQGSRSGTFVIGTRDADFAGRIKTGGGALAQDLVYRGEVEGMRFYGVEFDGDRLGMSVLNRSPVAVHFVSWFQDAW